MAKPIMLNQGKCSGYQKEQSWYMADMHCLVMLFIQVIGKRYMV